MVWAAAPQRTSWAEYLAGWAPWVGMLAAVRRLRAQYDLGVPYQAAAGGLMMWGWFRVSGFLQHRLSERRYREWERKYRLPRRGYSMAEVSSMDGSDPDRPILVVISGKVFNVSAGAQYYGKDGPYNIFAGRDATWLLAKGELELGSAEEMRKPLTEAEQRELAGWWEHFSYKYDLLGDVCSKAGAPSAECAPSSSRAPS